MQVHNNDPFQGTKLKEWIYEKDSRSVPKATTFANWLNIIGFVYVCTLLRLIRPTDYLFLREM